MKMGEHMDPVVELLHELNGGDVEANLKLLSLVISEFMVEASITGFNVSTGSFNFSAEITSEDGE